MKKLLFLAFGILMFTACQEDCDDSNTGDVCITNSTSEAVTVKVDGVTIEVVEPDATVCRTYPALGYTVSAEDSNGNSIYSEEVLIISCASQDIQL